MVPKRETPQAIEERSKVEDKYARSRSFSAVLRGMVSIAALCASAPFLAGLLFDVYGRGWEAAGIIFVLASFTLIAMIPKSEALLAIEGEGTAKQRRLPPWSLVIYVAILGLELNWACVFFWFSRRYAFFSLPVIGMTGLIMGFYAAIALFVARLTRGNWRAAVATFGIALVLPPVIILRSGILR
jgi:MFS family permease